MMGSVPTAVAHDASVPIAVCIDAPLGSQIELAWALKSPDPVFEVATADVFRGGPLEMVFEPPEATWGRSTLLSVTVEDPAGRRDTAHAPREVIVFAEPEPEPAEGSTGLDGSTGDTPLGLTTSSEGSGSQGPDASQDPSAPTGCAIGQPSTPALAAMFALIFAAATRRRTRYTSKETQQ
ncbi:MAG: hypothetical protein KUG77_27955 [Nannocystaceae bacterium]|nr:hypothetical protein [Nannocystaceae bacterium]